MLTLKLIWANVRKYWWVAAAVVGFILFKRWTDQSGDLAATLEKIQKAHQDEIDAINAANEQRSQATQQNLKKMQERLDAVEKQYAEAQQELDEQKKAEITDILAKDGHDPEALAKKLSEATGFRIILPD